MAWAKIDDGILDHPKILMAGEDAANLFIRSIIWSNKHLTDGILPHEACSILTRKRSVKRHIEALIRVGLWEEIDGGYRISGFLDHNESKEEVERKRELARVRQAKHRAKNASPPERSNASVTRDKRAFSASVTLPSPLLSSIDPDPGEEPPYSPPAPQGDAPAAPASRSRKARELSEGSLAVQAEIRERLGVEYPPSAFDALEARLRSRDLTPDDAIAIARFACADPFWGAEVKANPSTLYRPKHWASLLAQARAGPSKAPQVRTQFSGREPIPDEYARL